MAAFIAEIEAISGKEKTAWFGRKAVADNAAQMASGLSGHTLPQLETLHRRMAAIPAETGQALGVTNWNPLSWMGERGTAYRQAKTQARTVQAQIAQELADRRSAQVANMVGGDYAAQQAARENLANINKIRLGKKRAVTDAELSAAFQTGMDPEDADAAASLKSNLMLGAGGLTAGLGGVMLYDRMNTPPDPNAGFA